MIFLILLFLSAFLISSVSAYFSIVGLTTIFPGATIPIISMGVVLELGKLVTASFVYNYWNKVKFFRTILLGMTIILSLLSSVGVYGYLSRTHIEGTAGISTSVDQVAFVQRQIDMEQGNITFLQQSLAQGDKVVNNYLTDTTKTIRAEAARTKLLKERQKTQAEIVASNKKLLSLQQEKDSLSQIQRVKEVEVGPLKYLGALLSQDSNVVVRWFILTLTAVLDPLAILLVVAGSMHRKECRRTLTNGQMLPNADIPQKSPNADIPQREENGEPKRILPLGNVSSLSVGPEVTPKGIMEVTQKGTTKELDWRSDEKWNPPTP